MLEAMVGTRLCSGLQCEKFNVQKFVSRVVLVVSPFLVHVRLGLLLLRCEPALLVADSSIFLHVLFQLLFVPNSCKFD